MEALLAVRSVLELIRLMAGAGLEVYALLGELKQRIEEKGEAFGRDDVEYFKAKAEASGIEAQQAIDEVYGSSEE